MSSQNSSNMPSRASSSAGSYETAMTSQSEHPLYPPERHTPLVVCGTNVRPTSGTQRQNCYPPEQHPPLVVCGTNTHATSSGSSTRPVQQQQPQQQQHQQQQPASGSVAATSGNTQGFNPPTGPRNMGQGTSNWNRRSQGRSKRNQK